MPLPIHIKKVARPQKQTPPITLRQQKIGERYEGQKQKQIGNRIEQQNSAGIKMGKMAAKLNKMPILLQFPP